MGNSAIPIHTAGRQPAGPSRSTAPLMLQKLKALPQLRDVNTDLQNRGLEAGLVIDRETASRLGIIRQHHR